MKRKKQKNISLTRKGSIKIGKTLLICLMLIIITIIGEFNCVSSCQGAFDVEGTLQVVEGESFQQIIAQEDQAYLNVRNSTNEYIEIINISHRTNPERIGRFTFQPISFVKKMRIRDNILYTLISRQIGTTTRYNCSLTLINITKPSSLTLIGEYTETNTSIPNDFVLYQNYCYICTMAYLKILDLTNKTDIKLVTEWQISSNFMEESEGVLYLFSDKLQAYDLTNPEQPAILGELNDSRIINMGMINKAMDVKGKYVYTVYSGLLVTDFNDPITPLVIDEYAFPKRDLDTNLIEAIVISGEYLFTCGADSYVFSIKSPSNIRRIAKSEVDGISIWADGEVILITSWNDLHILSFHDQTKLIVGLSVSGGILLVISLSTIILFQFKKQKMKKGE